MNDYLPELISLAESRGLKRLSRVVKVLDEKVSIPTVAYPDLDAPPASDLPSLLGQFVRRGPQRALVEALLAMFEGRQLERALIAWDALAQNVIPDWEGDYSASLRACAAPARDILPPPGQAGVRTDVAYDALLDRLSPPEARTASMDGLLDAVGVHDLAAYRAVQSRFPDSLAELRRAEVTGDVRRFARLLSLAHLPTLASFYLRFAWETLGEMAAREQLVETLCDCDAGDRLPRELFTTDGQPVGDELSVYASTRTLISRGAPDVAFAILGERYGGGKRPHSESLGDRVAVVYAELTADIGEVAVPAERIARITEGERLWRYASRVAATMALRFAPRESRLAADAINTYITGFGDDYRFWRAVLVRPSMDQLWFPQALGVLVAETVVLPHSQATWRAWEYLADPGSSDSEVANQLRRQSTL